MLDTVCVYLDLVCTGYICVQIGKRNLQWDLVPWLWEMSKYTPFAVEYIHVRHMGKLCRLHKDMLFINILRTYRVPNASHSLYCYALVPYIGCIMSYIYLTFIW